MQQIFCGGGADIISRVRQIRTIINGLQCSRAVVELVGGTQCGYHWRSTKPFYKSKLGAGRIVLQKREEDN